MPCMPGMRWSLITSASASPRLFSSLHGRHRLLAGAGADERVIREIGRQVAPHRRQHLRIVVDEKNDRLVEHCASGECQSRRSAATPGTPSGPAAIRLRCRPRCGWTRRRTISSPRPVPWPTGLVVKNGSKIRSRISAGCQPRCRRCARRPRVPSRPPTTSTWPDSRDGVQRVVDQVGPDLVQLADEARGLSAGRARPRSHTAPTSRGLRSQNGDRVAQPLRQVHRLGDRRLVHVREALDRHDQARDPHRGVLNLGGEARAPRSRRPPSAARRRARGRRPRRRAGRAPRSMTAVSASASAAADVQPTLVEPVGDRFFAFGLLDRRLHSLLAAHAAHDARTASIASNCASVSRGRRRARASPARRRRAGRRAAPRCVRSRTPGC